MKFAAEKFSDVLPELRELIPLHWAEIAVHKDIPLDPDFDLYGKLAELGVFRLYTARTDNGKLIGYAGFFVRAGHMHYKGHTWAASDVIWLHPDYRQEGIGTALAGFWDEQLKLLGVHVVHVTAKVEHPALAYMLRGVGYKVVEAGYDKRLN